MPDDPLAGKLEGLLADFESRLRALDLPSPPPPPPEESAAVKETAGGPPPGQAALGPSPGSLRLRSEGAKFKEEIQKITQSLSALKKPDLIAVPVKPKLPPAPKPLPRTQAPPPPLPKVAAAGPAPPAVAPISSPAEVADAGPAHASLPAPRPDAPPPGSSAATKDPARAPASAGGEKPFEGTKPVDLDAERPLDALLKGRAVRLASAALVLAALAGAGAWLWTLRRSTRAFELGYQRPLGLIRQEGSLSSVDWVSQELFTVEENSGRVLRAGHIANPSLTGLALGERRLWSVDAFNRQACLHRLEDYALLKTFPLPGAKPAGASWDGRFLWTADQETGTLYQHRVGSELKTVFEAALPAGKIVSLAHVGGDLWVLDAPARLRRYEIREADNLDGVAAELAEAGRADLSGWLLGKPATGFAVDSGFLWLLSEQPGRLSRHRLKNLRWK